MQSKFRSEFVLLDLGHPMNSNSINNIITSLKNILPLALAFSQSTTERTFGISILNSDFVVFESRSYLLRNYQLIARNLNASLKMEGTFFKAKSSRRVTVPEYKQLLSSSIEAVLREYQKYIKENNIFGQLANSVIQIAVVTKKTASLLADILRDVTSKLKKNFPNMPSVKNYKIVQILNKEENIPMNLDKNLLIDSTFCLDNVYQLNCFFKEWLLHEQKQLKILLSKELNLEVYCDVDDCIANPHSIILDGNDICCRGSKRGFPLCATKPASELEIINKFPACGFCPTFVFGTPRRITATQSCDNWTESQINLKIFKQLCQELYRTGEGLLAKSVLSIELNAFHLLTSDGNMLLMNDVVPEELCLPTPARISKSVNSCEDESAASVIKACFEKIKHLDEYSPKYYSSGIYEYLKNHLAHAGERKTLFGHFDPNLSSIGKKSKEKDKLKSASNTKIQVNENPAKRPETELENIHPALLSPNVVEKYRKVDSQAFHLPELSRDYNENLR